MGDRGRRGETGVGWGRLGQPPGHRGHPRPVPSTRADERYRGPRDTEPTSGVRTAGGASRDHPTGGSRVIRASRVAGGSHDVPLSVGSPWTAEQRVWDPRGGVRSQRGRHLSLLAGAHGSAHGERSVGSYGSTNAEDTRCAYTDRGSP